MATLDSLSRPNLITVLNNILNQYKAISRNMPLIEDADLEIRNAKFRIHGTEKIPAFKKSSKGTVGTILIVVWVIYLLPMFMGGLGVLLSSFIEPLGNAMDLSKVFTLPNGTVLPKGIITAGGILAMVISLGVLLFALNLKKRGKKETIMNAQKSIAYQNRDDVKAETSQRIKEEMIFIEQKIDVSNHHRNAVNAAMNNLNNLYRQYNVWPDMQNIHALLFMCYEVVCSSKTSINEIRQQYIRMQQHNEIVGLLNRQIQIIEQGFAEVTGLLREGIRLDQIRNQHLANISRDVSRIENNVDYIRWNR